MKKLFNFLTPSFLQKLDHYLLLNNRLLWISKIHYIAFFAYCIVACSALYLVFVPRLPFELPSEQVVVLSSSLVVAVGVLFWIYKQISFDIETGYGQTFGLLAQSRLVLSTVCLLLFAGIVEVNRSILSWKTATIVSDSELREDINALNLGNYFFPTYDREDNSLLTKRQFDSLYEYNDVTDIYDYSYFTPYFYANKDSNAYANFSEGVLSDEELKAVLKKTTQNNRLEIIDKYMKTYSKYGGQLKYISAAEVLTTYEKAKKENAKYATFEENPFANELRRFDSYSKDYINNVVSRIATEKFVYNKKARKDMYSLVFSLAFMSSCLLMVYHFVRLRDLIIAAVALLCVSMATVFVGKFAYQVLELPDSIIPLLFLGIYVFALLQSLKIFRQDKYSVFTMCCLILVSLSSPLLVFLLGVLGDMMNLYQLNDNTLLSLILGGMGIYLVVMLPFFHRLFMKIKSLPYV